MPNRYFGFNLYYREWFYDETEFHHSTGSFSVSSCFFKSEFSHIIGLGTCYGWQVTAGKHATFDFYIGAGAYYRNGRIYEIVIVNWPGISYQKLYHQSGIFPSLQSGMKIGFRWGKRV
jgi:hypothetical protein